jgi:hypothetical protein
MKVKKYLPSLTQAVQVFVLMVVMTTFGVIAKGRGFVGKLVGR